MRFLFRSMIVLAIAVGLGVVLYYAVQALPNDAPGVDPAIIRIESGNNQPDNPGFPPEGNRPDRGERGERGLSLRELAGVVGKTVMFSVITFVVVMIKMLFKREPAGSRVPGG